MSDAAVAKVMNKRAAKTAKGRRILRKREPQIVEDGKTAIHVAGSKASADVSALLRDLHSTRRELGVLYMHKHPWHPFEEIAPLEKLCMKHDHGMFVFGSSSKKRPFRLIIGRLFDGRLLDMQEYKVADYKSCKSFGKAEVQLGSKPLVVFQGTAFEGDESMKRAKSLLLDYFSGARPQNILLSGIEHVIVCSALGTGSGAGASSGIHVKRYKIEMKKSGSELPRVELEEIGPRFTLSMDREKEPDRERFKQAIKVPKAAKEQKVKNVSKDAMGKRKGRIHTGRQDFDTIHTVHHGESKRKKLKTEMDEKRKAAAAEGQPPVPSS